MALVSSSEEPAPVDRVRSPGRGSFRSKQMIVCCSIVGGCRTKPRRSVCLTLVETRVFAGEVGIPERDVVDLADPEDNNQPAPLSFRSRIQSESCG